MSAQPASLLTDEELLSAVRDGDQRAFGDLWRRHSRAGMRAAHSFKHLGEPADLVSEAFTRIFTVLQRGSGPTGAFRPYLYTTIRNISLRNVHHLAAATNVEIDFDTVVAPETVAD